MIWRKDDLGQVAVRLPESSAELVLTTHQGYEANWLVNSVPQAVAAMVSSGGRVVVEECRIPVGRLAVVADPFGNRLSPCSTCPREPTSPTRTGASSGSRAPDV